jgi:CubicO group peptidase (beta-lactamase class C family)
MRPHATIAKRIIRLPHGNGAFDMSGAVLEIIDRYHAERDFSGVCLVRQGDRDIVHQAWGLAHRGFGIPNTVATRFDVASVTKLFTAAAILQLVDRGLLALDARLMPLLGISGTPISDDATIFHCLTHTSGIGDDADEEAGEDYELLFIDKPNCALRETADFLPQCTSREPYFPPGEGDRYNNCAFVLLGLVIEKLTDMPYRDYVRQRIFAPAGMEGADFCAMDGVCEDFAEHYKKILGPDGETTWRKNIYSYPPIGSPDGGATVTANDLDRFLRAIRDNRLMSETASRQLLSPHVKRVERNGASYWYGFAFEFKLDALGQIVSMSKEGQNAGVASMVAYYPPSDTTSIALANQDCDVWAMHTEIETVLNATQANLPSS